MSDTDGALESSVGLDVVLAQTAISSTANAVSSSANAQFTTVNLTAQSELRVGASGVVKGDMLRLTSTGASVSVTKPTNWSSATPSLNNSLVHNGGIALVAAEDVQVYQFINAEKWMEYRAGNTFTFGVPEIVGSTVTKGTITEKLPSVLKSETLILESGGSLSILGTLTAKDHLELISGANVTVNGDIVAY